MQVIKDLILKSLGIPEKDYDNARYDKCLEINKLEKLVVDVIKSLDSNSVYFLKPGDCYKMIYDNELEMIETIEHCVDDKRSDPLERCKINGLYCNYSEINEIIKDPLP